MSQNQNRISSRFQAKTQAKNVSIELPPSRREDIVNVGSFIVRLQRKPLLKQKFELKLQIERNLDKAFSHRVPDMSVKGVLSRLHAVIDVDQCELELDSAFSMIHVQG